MQLPNRDGTPVDAVPFLVTVAAAFLVTYSFGPVYCLELGLRPPAALAVTTAVFLAVAVLTFHRFVWTVRPIEREEVPASKRFIRLLYGVLAAGLLMLALSLPFVFE